MPKLRSADTRRPLAVHAENTLSGLPDHLLCRILLSSTTHDDLLRWVSPCARVCPESVADDRPGQRGLATASTRFREPG